MGSEAPNKNNEIPPQEVISKLGRLSTLLADVKRAADEYWEWYHKQIDIRVSGTNCFKTLNIQCGNGYSMEFDVNSIYLFLKGPDGGRAVLKNGKGSIGDVASVPLQCWEALVKEIENLIREKVDKIEYLARFYRIFTATF